MDRMNHLMEVAKQSQHLPWVFAFFVGLVVVKKNRNDDVELLGDNVPATLIEGLRR